MKSILALLLVLPLASGQSTISSAEKYAYSANAGWLDFRPNAADGVVVGETFLSGNAYAANFGWVNLGDGSPDNGFAYSNNSATDSGLNLNSQGYLSGQAYAANIGWITFEQTYGQPRLDFITGKFSGCAYSANLGWISLATPLTDLVSPSLAYTDKDGDGISDAWEMQHFHSLLTANSISDYDKDGVSDLRESTANTDPLDAADYLKIVSMSHVGGVSSTTLTFTSNPARIYHIEYSSDLNGTWTDSKLGAFAPDAGTTTTRKFPHPGLSRLFFRATATKPLQP